MTYYTTENDAINELINRPHLKTGTTNCECGQTNCYYEYCAFNDKDDKIVICDNCYLNCANFERI